MFPEVANATASSWSTHLESEALPSLDVYYDYDYER